MDRKRICVFCGARDGAVVEYALATRAFALAMAARGLGLVYGGAGVGLMGVLADTMLAAGGSCIGVMPEEHVAEELLHPGLTRLVVTASLSERKLRMADLSDAFAMLPGGAGTLDEFFELWTAAQLGMHRKPLGVLNAGGYFDLLLRFLERAVADGFLAADSLAQICVEDSPEALLDALERRASAPGGG